MGSNNASFDDGDEQMSAVRVQINDGSDSALKNDQSALVKSSDFSFLIDNKSSSSKKSVLEEIREHLSQETNLENEKLIKDKDKKVDFGTISRRNKFKKSTDSSQRLILGSSYSVAGIYENELTNKTISVPFLECPQPQIATSDKYANENLNEDLSSDKLSCRSLFKDSNQLLVKPRSQLQEQYSIELKPFNKREVQIDLTSVGNGLSKSLFENPIIDASKCTNTRTLYHNYPSVEFTSQQAVFEAVPLKIKYRLGSKNEL